MTSPNRVLERLRDIFGSIRTYASTRTKALKTPAAALECAASPKRISLAVREAASTDILTFAVVGCCADGWRISTLSRLECGGTPDLETFMALCARMHEDPANFFYEETCEER